MVTTRSQFRAMTIERENSNRQAQLRAISQRNAKYRTLYLLYDLHYGEAYGLYNNLDTLKKNMPKQWLTIWKKYDYATGLYPPHFKIIKYVGMKPPSNYIDGNDLYINTNRETINSYDDDSFIKVPKERMFLNE
jgi:hypothetical protein